MNVMQRAWEIAKEGQKKFGGKVKEYFSQALRMAWAEKKAAAVVEMKGSEKQVKWAKDIVAKAIIHLQDRFAIMTNSVSAERRAKEEEVLNKIIAGLNQLDDAKWIIDNRYEDLAHVVGRKIFGM